MGMTSLRPLGPTRLVNALAVCPVAIIECHRYRHHHRHHVICPRFASFFFFFFFFIQLPMTRRRMRAPTSEKFPPKKTKLMTAFLS